MKYLPIFLWAVPSLLCAQSAVAPKLPEGPLLNRAGVPASWTITTQQAAGTNPNVSPGADKVAKPKIVLVVKDKNLIFERVLTEGGSSIETWRCGDVAIINQNKIGWSLSPSRGTTFTVTDYSKADFAGFDWISLENYSGPRDVNGKHCITFKGRVITFDPQEVAILQSISRNQTLEQNRTVSETGKAPDNPVQAFTVDSLKVDVEADIDNETRLPVQLIYKDQAGKTVTRSYLFQPPPAPLSLPPEVEKLLKNYQDHARRIPTGPAPI
jgi:hypothetical protein